MNSEWRNSTLGEFVRLQRGHDLTASEQLAGNVPIMGSAGQNGTHSKALANGPGVVIGRSGASAGRAHFVEVDYWPHNTCLYVTDFFGNSPRFAYYLLQTLDLAAFNSGSAQASLNRNFLYSIPLKIPQREVQDGIVGLLQTLDDRISLLRETNATLEAIAQALFKSWFIDFDPVRSKGEGRALEGMDEATAALFPDSFEESELGMVPRGWVVKRLSDVLKSKNERVEQQLVPEYASTNEGLVPRAKIYKKQLAASSSKNKLIRRGDLIFGLSRQVLNFGQMHDEIGSVSSAYKIYQIGAHEVIPELLGRLIRTRSNYFFNAVSASSREGQSVSSDALGMLSFVQPPIDVQNILWLAMQPLLSRGILYLKQAESLGEIRDTLLPLLISGQLRLPEAEALLEEACA